jgi:hypothetical protein
MKTYADRDRFAGLSVVQREIVTALMAGVPMGEIRKRQRVSYERMRQHLTVLAVRFDAQSPKAESVVAALWQSSRAA